MPYWLLPSLAGDDDACKQHLRGVFCGAVANGPVFAHAVGMDERCMRTSEYPQSGNLLLLTKRQPES